MVLVWSLRKAPGRDESILVIGWVKVYSTELDQITSQSHATTCFHLSMLKSLYQLIALIFPFTAMAIHHVDVDKLKGMNGTGIFKVYCHNGRCIDPFVRQTIDTSSIVYFVSELFLTNPSNWLDTDDYHMWMVKSAARHLLLKHLLCHTRSSSNTKYYSEFCKNTSNRRIHVVFVMGLGEGPGRPPTRLLESAFQRALGGFEKISYSLLNNPKPSSQLGSIINTFCRRSSRGLSKFSRDVLEHVEQYLSAGYRVILMGHSYGGKTVNKIAQHVSLLVIGENRDEKWTKWAAEQLRFVGLGSILFNDAPNVGMVNLMKPNDVALRCHRKSEVPESIVAITHPVLHYDRSQRVLWEIDDPETQTGKSSLSKSIIVHNSYLIGGQFQTIVNVLMDIENVV